MSACARGRVTVYSVVYLSLVDLKVGSIKSQPSNANDFYIRHKFSRVINLINFWLYINTQPENLTL